MDNYKSITRLAEENRGPPIRDVMILGVLGAHLKKTEILHLDP
jgi:hypothetical protein